MAGELYTAVDFGADAVKVVSLRYRKDRIEVVGAAMATLSETERADENRDAVLSAVFSRLIRKHSIPLGHTVVGLSGRGTMLRYVQVPVVPHWKLSLLMGFEVEEQMGSGGGAENVAYDFRILNLPHNDEGQFPVLLALAQVPAIEERMALLKQARRRADDVDLLNLGAFNLYRWTPQCPSEETTVLLDIGASETHVVLQHDMDLYYARTLSTGGQLFTQRIREALNLLGPEAEEYKQTHARIVSRDDETLRIVDDEATVSDVCYAEARSLAIAVGSSLRFFSGTYQLGEIKPDRMVITGGGARLSGLPQALSTCMRCPVERLQFDDVVVPVSRSAEAALAGDAAHQFSAAMGMAIARARGGFSVSLLPPAVRERRDFWRRRIFVPYAAALAIALLVLVGLGGCPWYGGGWREAAYYAERSERWETHLKEADNAHKEVNALRDENLRLADQVEALALRGRSGEDIARGLVHITSHTPRNVFFTGLSTAEIAFDEENAGGGGLEAPVARPDPEMPSETFQSNRFLDLKGILVGVNREQEAGKQLLALRDSLSDGDVFSRVTLERSEILPADSEEVRAAFALRIGSDDEKARTMPLKPTPGLAAKFIIRCRIK